MTAYNILETMSNHKSL